MKERERERDSQLDS